MNIDTDIVQRGEIAKTLGEIANAKIRRGHGRILMAWIPLSRWERGQE
ncbi:MAG: hypothetical protein R3F40_11260 [Candidatus Competibacteraceae bacterium]